MKRRVAITGLGVVSPVGIGKDDFLYSFNEEYRRWLEANHLEYTYYESAGGHTWDNWQDYICRFLKKLYK